MIRFLLALLVVLVGVLALLQAPAAADGCVGDAAAQQDGYNAGVTCTTDGPAADGEPGPIGEGAPAVTYVYEPACERGQGIVNDGYYGCGAQQTCGDDGLLFNVTQVQGGVSTPIGFTCVEEGEETPEEVLTPGRILEAFRRIPVPTPQVGVNPVGGRTLVNFDTILHTEAQPFTTTVTLLRRQVTFFITPSKFTWRTGQGDFTTSEPGREFKASLPMSAYVTHRYLRAGKVELGLDTTWTARWRVGDGPWQPVNGTVTTSSQSVPLDVVTARPQLVSYD